MNNNEYTEEEVQAYMQELEQINKNNRFNTHTEVLDYIQGELNKLRNFNQGKNGLESDVHWMKLLGFGSFAEAMQKANVGDLVFAAGVITYEDYTKKNGEFVLKTVMKVNSFSIVKAKYSGDEEQQPEKPKKRLVSNRR